VGADGIIIPMPPPGRPPVELRSLTIKYHRVTVTIRDQVATTHVDQVFVNDLGYEIEGEYIFPIPEGASISQFAMWVDGKRLEAQVLERDQAREIYERIVRERRDPALLEYVGRNAFRARIYPIPARGEKRVELEYTEVLPLDGGLVKYLYPLNTEKFSARPLEVASVAVTIETRTALKAIYSPSHEISVAREGDHRARVGYEETQVTPDRDFALYYTVADDALGVNVLSYKEAGEDGYFLMLAAPRVVVGAQEIVARDLFLVLDVSGSMRGDKLAQAKRAAKYVLDNLQADDRFNIVAFSTGTRHYASAPRPASERAQAIRFVNDLQASGGTNINRALEETLTQATGERPQVILFLTDGLPTEGERRELKIVERVAELAAANKGGDLSLFAFGVGYDVNTLLLDRLAQDNHGTAIYVRPTEDIERAVTSFYEKISTPVLTKLKLDWGKARVDDVYPYPLPDLFAGGQLVVVGRYRAAVETTITLTGVTNGRAQAFKFDEVRLRAQGGADFIPRLWATRKIGYLLTQIQLHGAQRELIDEVIALSVRHGIVTPYTSFLVDETEDALSAQGREKLAARELAAAPAAPGRGGGGSGPTEAPAVSGERVVEKSIEQRALREADVAAAPQTEQVRTVGARTFVLRAGVWTDTTYDPKLKPERIAFGSARYFELLAKHPEWGRYLALGPDVLLMWEGRAYEVVPGGAEIVPTSPTPTSPSLTPGPTPAPSASFWALVKDWIQNLLR
ncbi:MAG: VIT domain-containing protein, partial [Chloroflexota bacterium]